MKFRYIIFIIFFALVYGGLIFKLYDLQLNHGVNFLQQVEARESITQGDFNRGTIYFTDRYQNSIPAGINKKFPVIYAVPKEINGKGGLGSEGVAENLAAILGVDEKKLAASLSSPTDLYKLLLNKASDQQAKSVGSLKLKGVYVDDRNFRYYPFQNLASQAIGYVGVNQNNNQPTGLCGLESFYNDSLSNNEDLHLTIDRVLQSKAEDVLTKLVNKFEATAGTVIIENPSTGEILAMGNTPNFDPNDYSHADISSFLNPAIKSLYEPGSVLKLLTMAAGIDSNKITPTTTYYDKGFLTLNGQTIRNWDNKAHGLMTMTNVIEQSLNTGAAWAEKATGDKIFHDYLVKFGLEEATGVDFSQERAGNLNSLERKNAQDIDFASASFGQGVSVTPLELINAISVIANGGNLMRPYFNADLKPEVVRRVISADTAKKVTAMMVSAVDKAEIAAIPGYRVAGKTGTAQLAENGAYGQDVIDTYTGFAPAENPQFIILIKIDKPKGAPLAGLSVVPAFKELAQFVLNYYNTSPDRPITNN